jgi:hypothetical protein
LFLPRSICGWNLTSPVSLLKSLQVSGQHILKHSNDPLTRTLYVDSLAHNKTSSTRRWLTNIALEDLENIINFNVAFGGHVGSRGLGYTHSTDLRHCSLKEKRKAISMLCKQQDYDNRLVSLHSLALSGNFLKWDNLMATQLDWNALIQDSVY